MTDHAEEQEMEAEAMSAIFDTNFEVIDHNQWRITIYPETGTTDEQELEHLNNVGCRLLVTLPETYPEDLPQLDIEIVKGLANEHQEEIQRIAIEEATTNLGTPSIYAVTERVREWLIENNVKGLDDISMHAQMMRKKIQEAKLKVRPFVFAVHEIDAIFMYSVPLHIKTDRA
jgi:RWD domain